MKEMGKRGDTEGGIKYRQPKIILKIEVHSRSRLSEFWSLGTLSSS